MANQAPSEPTRLVYGPAPQAGYEGIIVDAWQAEDFGALAHATTHGQFAAAYGQAWDTYLQEWKDRWDYVPPEERDDEDADDEEPLVLPTPEVPFDFEEWFSDVQDYFWSPQQEAWEVAHRWLSKLIAEGPEVVKKIESGGGSPGGNIDVIQGPLEALEYLAANVDPDRDGFTLERDDDLIEAAFPPILYGGA